MQVETEFADGVLTVRRDFPHAIDEVFAAWIDAAKTTHWWGCANTTRVVSEVEPKLGGRYKHRMTIAKVGDYAIDGRIIEYAPPHKLAYTMPATEFSYAMQVTVTFEAIAGGTRVTLQQTQLPDELQDVVGAGWTASFNRLARYFDGGRRVA